MVWALSLLLHSSPFIISWPIPNAQKFQTFCNFLHIIFDSMPLFLTVSLKPIHPPYSCSLYLVNFLFTIMIRLTCFCHGNLSWRLLSYSWLIEVPRFGCHNALYIPIMPCRAHLHSNYLSSFCLLHYKLPEDRGCVSYPFLYPQVLTMSLQRVSVP